MLDYNDPRWSELPGGYKTPYDPTPAFKKLEAGIEIDNAWEELWNELHHQGDIGEASYAAIPQLVRIHKLNRNLDWNLYALVATIKTERHRKSNPALPQWLETSYFNAMADLLTLATEDLFKVQDEPSIRAILGVLALTKGATRLGALINYMDESELDEYLDDHLDWSELGGRHE